MGDVFVGSVAVGITPSTDGFADKLRAAIVPSADTIGQSFGQSFSEKANATMGPLIQKWGDTQAAPARETGEAAGTEFAEAFSAKVKEMADSIPTIELKANATEADETVSSLKAKLDELSSKTIGVDLTSTEAMAQLDDIKAQMQELSDHPADISIDSNVINWQESMDKVTQLRSEVAEPANFVVDTSVAGAQESSEKIDALRSEADKPADFVIDATVAGASEASGEIDALRADADKPADFVVGTEVKDVQLSEDQLNALRENAAKPTDFIVDTSVAGVSEAEGKLDSVRAEADKPADMAIDVTVANASEAESKLTAVRAEADKPADMIVDTSVANVAGTEAKLDSVRQSADKPSDMVVETSVANAAETEAKLDSVREQADKPAKMIVDVTAAGVSEAEGKLGALRTEADKPIIQKIEIVTSGAGGAAGAAEGAAASEASLATGIEKEMTDAGDVGGKGFGQKFFGNVTNLIGGGSANMKETTEGMAEKLGKAGEEAGSEFGGAFSGIMSKVAQFGMPAAIGVAATAVFAVLGEKLDIAQKQLEVTLKNSGSDWDAWSGKVQATGKAMTQFGYTQDQVDASINSVLKVTGSMSEALGAQTNIANIAAASHISLTAATKQYDQALSGAGRAVKQLGIQQVAGATDAAAMGNASKFLTSQVNSAGSMAAFAAQHHISLAQAEKLVTEASGASTSAMDKLSQAGLTVNSATKLASEAMGGNSKAAATLKKDHLSLSQVQDLLTESASGNIGAYNKLGIEVLPKTATAAQKYAQVQAVLNDKLGGQAASVADTFGGKLKIVEATAINLGESIGMKVLPVLEDLMNVFLAVLPVIEKVVGAIAKIADPVVAAFLKGLSDVFKVLTTGPMKLVAGIILAIAAAWLVYANAAKIAALAQAAFDAVSPLGWIVLAVAAVVTIIGVIDKFHTQILSVLMPVLTALKNIAIDAWNGMKNTAVSAFNGIMTVVGPVITFFKTTLPAAFQAVLSWVKTNWPLLAGIILAPMTLGVSLVIAAVVKFHTDIANAFTAAWNAVKSGVTTAWDGIESVFTTAIAWVRSAWTTIWTWVSTFFSGQVAIVRAAASAVVNGIEAVFTTFVGWVRTAWNTIWSWVSTFFTEQANVVRAAATAVVNGIETVFTTFVSWMRTAWNTIWSWVATFFTDQANIVRAAASAVVNAIETVFTTFVSWMRTAWNTIWAWVATFFTDTWNGIKVTITGVVSWIEGAFTTLVSWIKAAWSDVWNAVKAFFEQFVATLKAEITDVWNWIKAAFSDSLNAVKDAWNTVWGAVRAFFEQFLATLKSEITDVWNWIKAAFSNSLNAVKDAWNTVWGAVKAFFEQFVANLKSDITDVWNWIKAAFSNSLNAVKTAWNTVWGAVKAFFEQFVANLKADITSAWNWIKAAFSNSLNAVKTAWNTVWGAVKAFFEQFVANLKADVTAVWGWMKSAFSNSLDAVKSTWNNAWNAVRSFASGVWNGIKSDVSAAFGHIESAFTTAVSSIKGIWNGIENVLKAPMNWLINTVYDNGIRVLVNDIGGVFGKPNLLPKIGGFAGGTSGAPPGWAWVGEEGPELVNMVGGETVIPTHQSMATGLWGSGRGYAKGTPGGQANPNTNPPPGSPAAAAAAIKQQTTKEQALLATENGDIIGKPLLNTLESLFGDALAAGLHAAMDPMLNAITSKFPQSFGTDVKDMLESPIDQAIKWLVAQDQPTGSGSEMDALAFMMKQIGKKYSQASRYGPNSWDCSGLVWGASHQAGIPMPGGPGANNAAAIVDPELQWVGAQAGSSNTTDITKIQKGDYLGFHASDQGTFGSASMIDGDYLMVGKTKILTMGHIGMASSPTTYVSAYDTAEGVINKDIASDKFAIAVRLKGGGAVPGTNGSSEENGAAIYSYLLANLFQGNNLAAAGAIASMWGESSPPGWNPESQGTGGNGIMGWTPPVDGIVTGNVKADLAKQIPLIIEFVNKNGDSGVIKDMLSATSVAQAANFWMTGVERAGISDVHAQGIAAATAIMNAHASGTYAAPAGWSWVGENGKELIKLRGGEQIMSHEKSLSALKHIPGQGYTAGTVGSKPADMAAASSTASLKTAMRGVEDKLDRVVKATQGVGSDVAAGLNRTGRKAGQASTFNNVGRR